MTNLGTKRCVSCQNSFTIEPEDLAFYEKVGVPVPGLCPACRMQRRLAHRNERTLYRRTCDLCSKEMVAIYPAGTPWPVYCAPCWWSDTWDAKDYGLAYNPNRPFFDQFKQLQAKVPRIGLLSINSENSEYTNNSADNKNCYLLFASEQCENCSYGRLIQSSRDVMDCAWVYDSEACYECVDCVNCYGCSFAERCQNSSDLWLCFDVRDSKNCILSSNQRHAEYLIENQQYTKETYESKKQELLGSPEKIEALKAKFSQMKSKAIVPFAYQTNCEAVTGDYLWNCQDSRHLFDVRKAKDCAYLADVEDAIDCYDGNNIYYKPELCYNLMGILQCYNSHDSSYIFYCRDVAYSDSCHNCTSCFGSIGLRKSNFCLLNKEYPEDEYRALVGTITEELRASGQNGSFLPPGLAPHGYNETLASDYFPLSKEEAIAKGFRWQEATTGSFGQPDPAAHIYACTECGKNFRLTPDEVALLQAKGLPFPTKDFECRHQARVRGRTPRKLWHRSCMCDKPNHEHRGNCANEFETSYAPERPEAVYCEQCYQAEVV